MDLGSYISVCWDVGLLGIYTVWLADIQHSKVFDFQRRRKAKMSKLEKCGIPNISGANRSRRNLEIGGGETLLTHKA
jgi:hypothetical protein